MVSRPGTSGSAADTSRAPADCRGAGWDSAPDEVRRAVEALVGPVSAAASATTGLTALIATALVVARGKVFVKAMPRAHRNGLTLANEARIAPSVMTISPRLLHHGTAGGWDFLVFEHVDGRPADLSPNSPDLQALARVLRRLLGIARHDTSASVPVEVRWERFRADLDLGRLAGDQLIHTDFNAGNILLCESGRAVLVDWALPARGAGWLNIGFLLASLIGAGFPPAQAERWAQRTFPEWPAAGGQAIDVFVAAIVRRRSEQAATCPVPRRAERQRQLLAVQQWLRFRCGPGHRNFPGVAQPAPVAPCGHPEERPMPQIRSDTAALAPRALARPEAGTGGR